MEAELLKLKCANDVCHYTEKKTYLSQVNCVILSQEENLFESSKNLFGSSIFVFLSQKRFSF